MSSTMLAKQRFNLPLPVVVCVALTSFTYIVYKLITPQIEDDGNERRDNHVPRPRSVSLKTIEICKSAFEEDENNKDSPLNDFLADDIDTMSPETIAICKAAFEEAVINNVDSREEDKILIALSIVGKAKNFKTPGRKQVLSMFASMSSEHELQIDDGISFQQFLVLVMIAWVNSTCVALFSDIDENHDGFIEYEEFKTSFCKSCEEDGVPPPSDENLRAVFDRMDVDKDGKVQFGEFYNDRIVDLFDTAKVM